MGFWPELRKWVKIILFLSHFFASKELNLQAIYLQALNYISKIALLKGVQSCFSIHN